MSGFAEGAVSKRGAVDDLRQHPFLGRKSTLAKITNGTFISSLDSRADPLALSTR